MRADDWSDAKDGIRGRLCVEVTTPLQTALLKMRRWAVHHLVVERDGVILGVVSDRDIVDQGLMDNGIQLNPVLTIGDVFKREVPVVNGADDLREVARVMRSHRTDAVLVRLGNDGYGILTATDLLAFLEHSHRVAEVGEPERRQGSMDAEGLPLSGEGSLLTSAQEVMANPIAQGAMRILADAGI